MQEIMRPPIGELNVLQWFWGQKGGSAKFGLELARELRRVHGINLVVSCAEGSELQSTVAAQLGDLPLEPVPIFLGAKTSWRGRASAALAIVRLPLTMVRFRRILRKHRVDVVLCTHNSIWDAATLPVLARSPVRFVQILHDATLHPGDEYPLRERIMTQQCHRADGIIVLSDHVKQQAIARFGVPEDRVWKMPHGAFSYSAAAQAAVHPRGTRPMRLLFFGRIVAYKGLDRLLTAFRLLIARKLLVELTIAGSGSLAAYAPNLTLPGLIIHNEWLSDDEIAAFISASDIVVLPYSEASQSGVAVTAYTAGRPVVATPVGGLTEQVQQERTGLIAQDMSPDALADALAEFIDDPALFERCAAEALRHASEDLGWQNCATIVAEVLRSVHARPRRP